MKSNTIRIATRESPLALWQANHIRSELHRFWPSLQIELLPMTTSGDRFLTDKLLAIGGKGLFVKELEEALFSQRADIAVHSMKDLPITLPDGLTLAAICHRETPFDALVGHHTFSNLPEGAVVGTASLRRQAQLLAVRPDLIIKSLRGNVGTRLGRLDAGEYDAIVLAASGLQRLNFHARIQDIFNEQTMLPACGQGALGIECRIDDDNINKLIAPLHHPLSALCVQAEREVNARLGGNCHTTLAVYCKPEPHDHVCLNARVTSPDGSIVINTSHRGHQEQALDLATKAANKLLLDGADALLSASTSHD